MSLSTQQKTIDGKNCTVVQYPGMEGLRIWTNLVKIFGPSMISIGGGIGDSIKGIKDFNLDELSSVLDSEINLDKLFSTLSEALILTNKNINEDIVEQLVLRMLASTKIDNQEITLDSFNILFCGNYGLLLKVLTFVLKVNYSSFLGGKGHSTSTNQNPSLSSVLA